MNDEDIFDEALARLSTTADEFGPGLTNHGPMACEALIRLRRSDAVDDFMARYSKSLVPLEISTLHFDKSAWRSSLGKRSLVGGWQSLFTNELVERPFEDVIATWVPRLAPGAAAAATHGLLRTAHAVRSIEKRTNELRIAELARGLSYWAATYQELPGPQMPTGEHGIRQAVSRIPLVDSSVAMTNLISSSITAVADTEGFDRAVGDVMLDDPQSDLSTITSTFAQLFLDNPHNGFPFIHTVTAPSACRHLLPYLSDLHQRELVGAVWRVSAAIFSRYASDPPQVKSAEPSDVATVVEHAVDSLDDHAIKFVEACTREHNIAPSPAYLAAADAWALRVRQS